MKTYSIITPALLLSVILLLTVISCKKKEAKSEEIESKDWSLITTFSGSIKDVCESGTNNIWVVGMNGFVANSEDNGKSWAKKVIDPVLSNQIFWSSVYFISPQIGWIGGDGNVYKTTNGGNNWTPIFTRANGNCYFPQLTFFTEDFGIICGMYGTIFRTTDGGNSWTDLTIKPLNNVTFGTPQFINAAKGWISGANYPTLIKTIDSGKSWTILHSMDDLTVSPYRYSSTEVCVVNENNLYSAGNSTDGGNIWNETGTLGPAFDLSMKNSQEGISLNETNKNPNVAKSIGHTYNAGKNWTFFDLPYSSTSPGFGHLKKSNGHLYGYGAGFLYRYAKNW
jgi:photosystem II stability/assembly factor-like uncharacterized protein